MENCIAEALKGDRWNGTQNGTSRGFSRIVLQQAFRRGVEVDVDTRNRSLHSSSVELKSSATAAARAAEATAPAIEHVETEHHGTKSVVQESPSVVELTEDGGILYSQMTSKELLVTLFNLQLLSYEPMVEFSLKILNSRLLRWPVTSTPLLWLIKRTTYRHFCAGEDIVEAGHTLSRMWELGLRGVLDYSLEDAEDDADCDANCDGFLKTIAATNELPDGSVCSALSRNALCMMTRLFNYQAWTDLKP